MRLVPDGPDLPLDLLRARQRGEVLFVCGAGISCRAGLPDFGELAQEIYESLNETWEDHPAEQQLMTAHEYDRLLRTLERRLIGSQNSLGHLLRRRIRNIVAASLRPADGADLSAHRALLELSRGQAGRVRLLTTNFDTLFEHAAAKPDFPSHAGPGLPSPGTARFEGVLHLHGRIGDEGENLKETDLVLTSAEFGDAYLRNGWASRYVYDLVRTNLLVLVGYSANDAPMRYLLEAVDAERDRFPDLRPVYAFAPVDETEGEIEDSVRGNWKAKGITPLPYRIDNPHDHTRLYATLAAWRDYAQAPRDWRDSQIAPLLERAPDTLSPDELSNALDLLRAEDATLLLSRLSPAASWLAELKKHQGITPGTLVGPWISTRLGDPDMVQACLGANLSSEDWVYIEGILDNPDCYPGDAFRKVWRLIRRADRRSERKGKWHFRLRHGIAADDEAGFRDAVAGLLVPRLHAAEPFKWPGQGDSPVTATSLIRIEFEPDDQQAQRDVLKATPTDAGIEARLLQRLVRELEGALEEERDAFAPETPRESSYSLRSVAEHPQNRNSRGFAPLVLTIARLWERLAGRDRAAATAIADGWAPSPFAVVQRLRLHALTVADVFSPALACKGLTRLPRAEFWSQVLRRETMRLMALRWNEFPARNRRVLEKRLCQGPPRVAFRDDLDQSEWLSIKDHVIFLRLARIEAAGGGLGESVAATLRAIRVRHPEWVAGTGERDDFPNYTESWQGQRADPSVLADVPESEVIDRIRHLRDTALFQYDGLWDAYAAAEPIKALAALNAGKDFNSRFWSRYFYSILAIEDAHLRGKIRATLFRLSPGQLAEIADAVMYWLERSPTPATAEDAAPLLELWDRLAKAVLSAPAKAVPLAAPKTIFDVLNSTGGQLARLLADALIARKSPAGSKLPADLAPRFDRLTIATGPTAVAGRLSLIRGLSPLFQIDAAWAGAHLVPLLTRADEDTPLAWEAWLDGGFSLPPALFKTIEPALLRQTSSPQLVAHCPARLVDAVLRPLIQKRRDPAAPWDLAASEVKRALAQAPAALRRQAAWSLALLMEAEGDPLPCGERWRQGIGPVFEEIWPRDADCREAKTSEFLFWLATTTGDAFPAAAAEIGPRLAPFPTPSVRSGIGFLQAEDSRLPRRFPRDYLALLGIILEGQTPPRDLGELLAICCDADPGVEEDPAYRRLQAMALREAP